MEIVTDIRIVFFTTDTIENAKLVAKMLVVEGLAACCSIIKDVSSVFSWEGEIQERNEFILMIKTTESKLNQLEARILHLSPDEVPEILAVPVDYAMKEYSSWLLNSLV